MDSALSNCSGHCMSAPAREMAQFTFGNTLAFLDGVIEHLSNATPV